MKKTLYQDGSDVLLLHVDEVLVLPSLAIEPVLPNSTFMPISAGESLMQRKAVHPAMDVINPAT